MDETERPTEVVPLDQIREQCIAMEIGITLSFTIKDAMTSDELAAFLVVITKARNKARKTGSVGFKIDNPHTITATCFDVKKHFV